MESSYQGGLARDEASENFQRLSQTIASNIKKISQNVSSMSKMVNQLQTPQDSHELRNQLRQIQNYTQKLVKDTSALLMQMMRLPGGPPAARLARDRLSDEYMATLNAFQVTQRAAAQKTKEDVRKVRAQSAVVGDPFAMDSNRASGEGAGGAGGAGEGLAMRQALAAGHELLELEERERDIRQLEMNITDVNQIFKELGQMIHEQGTTVDSIEANVDQTATNVEAATGQLRHAASSKNKLRKKKVIIAVVVAVVASILLAVLLGR